MIHNIGSMRQIIKASCPSPYVNAWKTKLSGKPCLITPAHVAVYSDKKTNRYVKSEFISALGDGLTWYIPRLYTPNAYAFDFAFAVLDSDSNCIGVDILAPKSFKDVTLFFQTPYDATGAWNPKLSELGFVRAGLYPLPNSDLFEALDVGYKGMSGALVTTTSADDEPLVAGMLLRRGGPIPLKVEPPVVFDPSEVPQELRVLVKYMQHLADNMLTRHDVEALGNVTAMRRSLVMPVERMMELMDDSVPLNSIIGKPTSANIV